MAAKLPPAGDARRDELKRRDDDLAREAEERAASEQRHAINPKALRVESDIAQHFNALHVPNADPAYEYKWEQADIRRQFGNVFVTKSKAEGWEVVHADDEDAEGLEHARYVDNSLVVGDTVLMRIPKDRYLMLRRQREARQRAMESAVTSEVTEMAEKHRGRGVMLHSFADPVALRQQVAANRAGKQVDQLIREGRMPGVPAPGTQ